MTPVIAIVTQEPPLGSELQSLLRDNGLNGVCYPCRQNGPALQDWRADLVLIECRGAVQDSGFELFKCLRTVDALTPVILVVRGGSEALAIEALRLGAHDYLKMPVEARDLVTAVKHCLGACPTRNLMETPGLIGGSEAMQNVRESIRRLAPTDTTVLITGETGTGKELAAQMLHQMSRRRNKPLVCINCAAIPDTLLESELFGYERGAFTGAVAAKPGKLKMADGGTVFFDEIGDMSPFAQAKILRAIEAKEVHSLGSSHGTRVDIRIICATHRDLEKLMREDKFRADLYYRLNVARIRLPPLRERRSDIPFLTAHFLEQFNGSFGRQVERLSDEALEELLGYPWPGNVRELRNVIEGIFVNLPSRVVTVADLPDPIRGCVPQTGAVPDQERERLISALFSTRWNLSEAARSLHWSRMTLYRKMAKYHIVKPGAELSHSAKTGDRG